jgi:hypothetical protein
MLGLTENHVDTADPVEMEGDVILSPLTAKGKRLAAQCSDETGEHSYDQEWAREALKGGQGTDVINERQDSHRQRDT